MDYTISVPTVSGSSQYDGGEHTILLLQSSLLYRAEKNTLVTFGVLHVDDDHVESVKDKFERLKQDWLLGTTTQSSLDKIVQHPAYQEIIGMGEEAIPLILADLVSSPKPWFFALWKITGSDPLPESAAGNLKKMTAAWVKWGRKHGYLPAA